MPKTIAAAARMLVGVIEMVSGPRSILTYRNTEDPWTRAIAFGREVLAILGCEEVA